MSGIRLRFAPSPTGPLHIGGVRTALYNFLFAKKHNGTIILRLEDTDQKRFVPPAEDHIKGSLDWLGLSFDEGPGIGGDFGPYKQSERKEIYQYHIQTLIKKDLAYYAFDTPEELELMRKREEEKGNQAPKYDHKIRQEMCNSLTLPEEETYEWIDSNRPYTIRLKVTPGETISFHDQIRGEVKFQSDELDDKVLMKADGLPTYHLANIVDDYSMKITHVIRGEEWLSSTAHHILLYRAFGWEDNQPVFAHLPLILKPQGKGKLSKRDGSKFGIPVFPTSWNYDEVFQGFKEAGFLPEAVLNFLLLLGWNPGTNQELFSFREMIQAFDLEKIGKSGARFDYQKALWFNQQYIKNAETNHIIELVKDDFPETISEETLKRIILLFKDRCQVLPEFSKKSSFLYEEVKTYDEKQVKKKWKSEVPRHYQQMLENFRKLEKFDRNSLRSLLEEYIADQEIGYGAVMPPLRIALTGVANGPDLFELMDILGKEESIHRLETALSSFAQIKNKGNA